MPYVNIKITREGATREQKSELIARTIALLVEILGKEPATTMEDWGVGGLPVEQYRKKHQKGT